MDFLDKNLLPISLLAIVLISYLFFKKIPDPTPEWIYGPEAVHIQYNADKMLNFFNDKPHTLVLTIFQLTRIDAFNVQVNTEEGLRRLLRAERFDPSVVGINRMIIQPSDSSKVVFDRVENARWIGIVTGYYDMVPGQVNQTFKIPVIIEKKGWIRKRKIAIIGQINIDLILGPQTIHKAGTIDGTS